MSATKRRIKRIWRAAYSHVPLKQQLLTLLKPLPLPRRVQRHLRFEGVVTIEIDDKHSFRINMGGPIEWKLFWHGFGRGWEARSIKLWTNLAASARTIVDVGSNVGVYSLVARSINPTARIVAFEPLDRFYDRLQANIAVNGFVIDAEKIALSDHEGEALLFDSEREYFQGASLEGPGGPVTSHIARTVPLTRLDTYCIEHGIDSIDLLKLDVEGHEGQAIAGMGDLLTASKPTMLIEVLNDENGARVSSALSGLGCEMYRIHENGGLEPTTTFRSRQEEDRNYLVCQPGVIERHGLTSLVVTSPPEHAN